MGFLLARLPLAGRSEPADRPLPLWRVAAAVSAVSVLGLVALGAAVLVIETLDPRGGPAVGAAAALAGRLWLVASFGVLDLPSGRLALAPLLLTAGIAWALSRAGRLAVHADEPGSRRIVLPVIGAVVLHVVLTLLLALAVDGAGASVNLVRTAAGATALAVLAVGWGASRESGAVDAVLDRLPGVARPVVRAAGAGALTALALCTAVVAVAVAADVRGYAAVSGSLGGAGAAAIGLLALNLLLLPNAAAAALGLAAGPGFVIGTGTAVSVHGVTLGAVPALPLLAGLPDTQAVPLVAFASQAVPALAGLVAGLTLGRWMADDDGGSLVAALGGVLTGLLLGGLGAAFTWAAGGSLGDGALATVGAPPLATGIALAGQCGIAAAVIASITRWRVRG